MFFICKLKTKYSLNMFSTLKLSQFACLGFVGSLFLFLWLNFPRSIYFAFIR